MDGIYADEAVSMVNAAKNFSPRLRNMDNREVVSVLVELGIAVERRLCEETLNAGQSSA